MSRIFIIFGSWFVLKRNRIDSNSHPWGIWLSATDRYTNIRKIGCILRWNICCILLTLKIQSVVSRFLRNPFWWSDNWNSCQFRSLVMMFTVSLHTVEPILTPLYFVGSLLEPFPFQSFFKGQFLQDTGRSRFSQRLAIIRWTTWIIIEWLFNFFKSSGSMSIFALFALSSFRCFWISLADGGVNDWSIIWEVHRVLLQSWGSFSRSICHSCLCFKWIIRIEIKIKRL